MDMVDIFLESSICVYVYIKKFTKIVPLITPYTTTIISMLEKEVESALTKAIKKLGGLCWKFTSPGVVGVPDRLCLLHNGKIAFVEVKRPGEVLRPIQAKRKKQLEELGFKVFVLDKKEDVEVVIDAIRSL